MAAHRRRSPRTARLQARPLYSHPPHPRQIRPQKRPSRQAPRRAAVIDHRFVCHLPYYRQAEILARQGVPLHRKTLCDWAALGAHWLSAIYRAIRHEHWRSRYRQFDETPIHYLEPGSGKARTGYLWTSHIPGGTVLYHWRTGRDAQGVAELFGPATAAAPCTIQCDGYEAYPALREAVRASQSRMIHRRLKAVIDRLALRAILPQSHLGKAMSYAVRQWPKLAACLSDARIEIDNNLVENAIRPTKLGAKNWLFIGRREAGQKAAILYTIVENCRRLGIDAREYLEDVLTRLPGMKESEVATLMPANWLRARQAMPLKKAA